MPANSDTWTERMTIDSSGNVGIGTETPGGKLDIAETAAAPAFHLLNSNASDSFGLQICAGNDANDYAARIQDRTGTDLFRINGSGNVGIGATPHGTHADWTSISLGGTSFMNSPTAAAAGKSLYINQNAHLDTDGTEEYIVTDEASSYSQLNGAHNFRVAGSGTAGNNITWKAAMQICNCGCFGAVGIGTTPGRVGTSQFGTTHTFLSVYGLGDNSGIINLMSNQTKDDYIVGVVNFASSGLTAAYGDIARIYGALDGGTANERGGALVFETRADGATTYTERMRISSCGNVGIGTSTMLGTLHVYASDAGSITPSTGADDLIVESSGNTGISILSPAANQGSIYFGDTGASSAGRIEYIHGSCFAFSVEETKRLCMTTSGVAISGSLSKGSGSFRIEHPLESKKDTHQLVHSFIEGPQADLMYRGVVQLVDGSAQINIDTVSDMTDGTFDALNRCAQVFTTNESNWDAVRGSVTGNILTIESNTTDSTACISWMVVGERCDEHMMDTEWTHFDGRIIVEPENEVEPESE
jgi:hypothetical protein